MKNAPLTLEQKIDNDAATIAASLNVPVEKLKEVKVSIYDIVKIRHDEKINALFNSFSCFGGFNAATFCTIKALVDSYAEPKQ